MISKNIAAVLSLYVYTDGVSKDINLPTLPFEGWQLVEDPRLPAVTNGFAYGVFRNIGTGEIVISYRGTDGAGGMLGFDGLNNAALSIGSPSSQGQQATQVYAEVLRLYGADAQGSNIVFTGHSLGGGLASVMAVWFNRPAIVFDPAPFRPTAQSQERVDEAIQLLGNRAPQALVSFNAATNYASRSGQVTGYFATGEFLELLRTDASAVNLAGLLPQQFGNQNVSGFAMHSQALLTMGLMSTSFKTATVQVQNALPLILSDKLYSQDTKGLAERNFLIDLIRSEQTNPSNSKLSHFASDLNKLGTNIAGLNKAAQDAMIAQGIEWYYWQASNYAGVKEFFTQTGQLLQYTTAKGDGLMGALSKADLYTKPWIQAIAAEHGVGTATFPAFGTAYDQWNVAATTSTTSVTATARDATKSQIYLGGAGADNFTGGNLNDVILAGAGNDTLNGGAGDDRLYGGQGTDTYNFTGAWGKDTIVDADGKGQININGRALGSFSGAGKQGGYAFDLGAGQFAGLYVQSDSRSTTGFTAYITNGADTANSIAINNFDLSKAQGSEGYLGIKLDTRKLALTEGGGTNLFTQTSFNPSTLAGKTSTIPEGLAKSFTIYLSTAAKAGDTLTLALAGAVADKFNAVLGDDTVAANGAVITLKEGQTSVSFALTQEGAVDADLAGALSVNYLGSGTDAQTTSSNSWGISLKDKPSPTATTATFTGDKQFTNFNGDVVASPTSLDTDLRIATSATDLANAPDILFGDGSSASNDLIEGLGGNDLLSGMAGDDVINGGAGSDIINGGLGADTLNGGDGDDVISGSGEGVAFTTDAFANRSWPTINTPSASYLLGSGQGSLVAQGTGWTYRRSLDANGQVSNWQVRSDVGFTSTSDNTGRRQLVNLQGDGGINPLDADQGNTINAGGGADLVLAGTGADLVHGDEGDDLIYGLAGSDALYGDAGADTIYGDGSTTTGFLTSTPLTQHGDDLISGGARADLVFQSAITSGATCGRNVSFLIALRGNKLNCRDEKYISQLWRRS